MNDGLVLFGHDPDTKPIFDHDVDPFLIKTLVRSKGMDYVLDPTLQPWSWRRMLNGLQSPILERVVGPGITGFSCKPIEGSYDHKRRPAARMLGHTLHDPAPIWDFVVTRADGTAFRLHPSQTSNKVEIIAVGRPFETDGPSSGKGKSDGPGTYRLMLANSYNEKGAYISDKGAKGKKGTATGRTPGAARRRPTPR